LRNGHRGKALQYRDLLLLSGGLSPVVALVAIDQRLAHVWRRDRTDGHATCHEELAQSRWNIAAGHERPHLVWRKPAQRVLRRLANLLIGIGCQQHEQTQLLERPRAKFAARGQQAFFAPDFAAAEKIEKRGTETYC
jgi:hypothetical protein